MSTAIIVPCRNEAGTINALLESIQSSLRHSDELIIVEGGSWDTTWHVVSNFANRNPSVKVLQQTGKGKFDAVLNAIKEVQSEYVMIWDADGTVSYADNILIYEYTSDVDVLVMGDRLRGKREPEAMQFANFFGNWFFAIVWGILLKRKPLDTLCGTKKFPLKLLEKSPQWILGLDPYGDFTILAGAKWHKISVVSIPVEYGARKYGKTNIHRWSGGWILLKLTLKIIRNKY